MADGCTKEMCWSLWLAHGGNVGTSGSWPARWNRAGPYTETAPCGAGCGKANPKWKAVNGVGQVLPGVESEQLDALHELILVGA